MDFYGLCEDGTKDPGSYLVVLLALAEILDTESEQRF